MFVFANAVTEDIKNIEKTVENVVNNPEDFNKAANQMGDILQGLLDKAINFGIKLIIAFIIFIVGRILIRKLVKFIDKVMEKATIDQGVSKFLHSLINILAYVVLVIVICSQVGIDTTSFAAILASGGLAVGLAFEGSLSNFAGGVLILIMKPFVVGDYIESNGVQGSVEKIDIFYTSLITADNKSVKLPNGILSNSVLTNYSMYDKRRVTVAVGIGYDDDIKKAKDILNEIMNSYKNILKDEDNHVAVTGLGESSVNLEIRIWVSTDNYWDATFYLNESIKERFDAEGITIPYNQLDVRIVSDK